MNNENFNFPIAFDDEEAEDRFCHPEKYCAENGPPVSDEGIDLSDKDTGKKLFGGLIRPPGEELEVLPLQPEIYIPPAETSPPAIVYPHAALQVNGDFNIYRQEQTSAKGPMAAASEAKSPPAPKPMELAEKLMAMEHFAIYEKQLYVFDKNRGIYISLDRYDAKRIIVKRLTDDLRIRGTAYQIKEIYEFLRLDPNIWVVTSPPRHLLAFTNGVLDLKTSTFLFGHDPEDFITWRLEIPFDLNQNECPR